MIAQILSAVLGVLAFAVLFHAPRRSYVACAICGGFSWGMFLAFTALGLSEFLASTLAIIALTLLARILSVALMMPATVFIVTGIFPIVPGAGIYYTAYSLIVSDMALFQQKGMETLVLAGAIAIRYGDKTWYLYGASSGQHRDKMPNYLLQWEMIRWALAGGCRLYDFRGVSGSYGENRPIEGLYRFKAGFRGELVELMEEQDLVPLQ